MVYVIASGESKFDDQNQSSGRKASVSPYHSNPISVLDPGKTECFYPFSSAFDCVFVNVHLPVALSRCSKFSAVVTTFSQALWLCSGMVGCMGNQVL